MIIMTVRPSRRDDGSKAWSSRGQLFEGTVDGRLIVSRTTQPMLDACRILAGEGVDLLTRVAIRPEGQDHDALRSTIGAAAKLTVTTIRGKTVFAKWQPWRPSKRIWTQCPCVKTKRPVSDTWFGAKSFVCRAGRTPPPTRRFPNDLPRQDRAGANAWR
jgi:hypothetical protein